MAKQDLEAKLKKLEGELEMKDALIAALLNHHSSTVTYDDGLVENAVVIERREDADTCFISSEVVAFDRFEVASGSAERNGRLYAILQITDTKRVKKPSIISDSELARDAKGRKIVQ